MRLLSPTFKYFIVIQGKRNIGECFSCQKANWDPEEVKPGAVSTGVCAVTFLTTIIFKQLSSSYYLQLHLCCKCYRNRPRRLLFGNSLKNVTEKIPKWKEITCFSVVEWKRLETKIIYLECIRLFIFRFITEYRWKFLLSFNVVCSNFSICGINGLWARSSCVLLQLELTLEVLSF